MRGLRICASKARMASRRLKYNAHTYLIFTTQSIQAVVAGCKTRSSTRRTCTPRKVCPAHAPMLQINCCNQSMTAQPVQVKFTLHTGRTWIAASASAIPSTVSRTNTPLMTSTTPATPWASPARAAIRAQFKQKLSAAQPNASGNSTMKHTVTAQAGFFQCPINTLQPRYFAKGCQTQMQSVFSRNKKNTTTTNDTASTNKQKANTPALAPHSEATSACKAANCRNMALDEQ